MLETRILQASPFTVVLGNDGERLTVNVDDSTGLLITARARVAWSSADTTVVQVDQIGTLKPRQVGLATVRTSVDAHGTTLRDSIVVDVGRQIPLDVGVRPSR